MARMKKNTALAGAGDELTEWATPRWCVDGLVDHWPELVTWSRTQPILEPSAGSGSIVRALVARGAAVEAIEIRDTREQLEEAGAGRVKIGDFLQLGFGQRSWFAIVMNPPFRPPHVMLQHVRRALEASRAFVAALLPLSFLSGGSGRAAFWREHATTQPLTQILFFEDRPIFVGDGGLFECAWFVWWRGDEDGARAAPRAPAMIPAPVRGQPFNW